MPESNKRGIVRVVRSMRKSPRWLRASADTKGFHEWRRNAVVSILPALAISGWRFWRSDPGSDRVVIFSDVVVAVVTFVIAFCILPALEWALNFALARRRNAEDEVRRLTAERAASLGAGTVDVDLAAKLTERRAWAMRHLVNGSIIDRDKWNQQEADFIKQVVDILEKHRRPLHEISLFRDVPEIQNPFEVDLMLMTAKQRFASRLERLLTLSERCSPK